MIFHDFLGLPQGSHANPWHFKPVSKASEVTDFVSMLPEIIKNGPCLKSWEDQLLWNVDFYKFYLLYISCQVLVVLVPQSPDSYPKIIKKRSLETSMKKTLFWFRYPMSSQDGDPVRTQNGDPERGTGRPKIQTRRQEKCCAPKWRGIVPGCSTTSK